MSDKYFFLKFIVIIAVLQLLYIFYNSIRNIGNLYLILPLSFLRFYGFILPLVPLEKWLPLSIMFLFLYPLSKFLEFCKRPRHNLPKLVNLIGNNDLFRVKYYAIVTIALYFYFYFFDSELVSLQVAIYYFCFRTIGLILIATNKKMKSERSKFPRQTYQMNTFIFSKDQFYEARNNKDSINFLQKSPYKIKPSIQGINLKFLRQLFNNSFTGISITIRIMGLAHFFISCLID